MLDRNVKVWIFYTTCKHVLDNNYKPQNQAYRQKKIFMKNWFYFRPVETIIGAVVGGIFGLIACA